MKFITNLRCRVCGSFLWGFMQEWRHKPATMHIECHNPGCKLHMQTLNRDGYETLDLSPYMGHDHAHTS